MWCEKQGCKVTNINAMYQFFAVKPVRMYVWAGMQCTCVRAPMSLWFHPDVFGRLAGKACAMRFCECGFRGCRKG